MSEHEELIAEAGWPDDTEEFCPICFAGTQSSEHLAQPHGESDR